jgi:hypothetical protein
MKPWILVGGLLSFLMLTSFWEAVAQSDTVVTGPTVRVEDLHDNPFVTYKPLEEKFYRIHPFVDYTGAHSRFAEPTKLDYFGYRNSEDLYSRDSRDYSLIVMTGGSEAAGFSHRTTIAQHLERMLNELGTKTYKVLNLAINSYCLSNEISTYVHLAYHLKPEIVISHTGWNDMLYGMMAPPRFKELGLAYLKLQEDRLHRWYGNLDTEGQTPEWRYVEHGHEKLVDGYVRNLQKYETIVSGNGGQLIVGIQSYNTNLDKQHTLYGKMDDLYEQLLRRVAHRDNHVDFSKIKDIEFEDSCHSTENSSLIIARVYFGLVSKTTR